LRKPFLRDMELKHPEILQEFKKGQLNDESLSKMTKLAAELAPSFK
jgi:F-type H+-transporting ATPase subunit alpha